MVMMFVGGVVSSDEEFLYYSYSRKPMEWESFVPAGNLTLIGVKLFSHHHFFEPDESKRRSTHRKTQPQT